MHGGKSSRQLWFRSLLGVQLSSGVFVLRVQGCGLDPQPCKMKSLLPSPTQPCKIGKVLFRFSEPQFCLLLTTPFKQTNNSRLSWWTCLNMKEKMTQMSVITTTYITARRNGKWWADTEAGFSRGEMKRLDGLQPRSLSAGRGQYLRSHGHKHDLPKA